MKTRSVRCPARKLLVVGLAVGLLGPASMPAVADLVFVGITTNNTVTALDSTDARETCPLTFAAGSKAWTGGSGTDDLWRNRGTVNLTAIGGQASQIQWESSVPGEDAPILKTTISVPLGSYEVYVLWQTGQAANLPSPASSDWSIAAALSLGNLVNAGGTNRPAATYSGLDSPTIYNSGGVYYRYIPVGQVNDTTTLTLYVNDDDASGDRSRYLGIGYNVVPEPVSAMLFGLGGIVVALMIRRKQA